MFVPHFCVILTSVVSSQGLKQFFKWYFLCSELGGNLVFKHGIILIIFIQGTPDSANSLSKVLNISQLTDKSSLCN